MNQFDVKLGKWIFGKDFWQIRLEDESGLDSFASKRGISSFFMGKYIRTLWQLGLVKADLIKSSDELALQSIEYIGEDSSHEKYYMDLRRPQVYSAGLVDSAKGMPPLDNKIKLYFHPFRFFILVHLERILRVGFATTQSIVNSQGFQRVLEMDVESIKRATSQSQFVDSLVFWNDVVNLCIALEPHFYGTLFNRVKHSSNKSYEEHLSEIADHWDELEPILKNIGLDRIEKMRADLCVSAEMLDSNKEVHTLLRLTREEKSFLSTYGNLGGAMVLLTMAEFLRRGCEKAFSTKLKEEDELGFGMWVSGAKETIYGADRILDGNTAIKTQWLRVFGIDAGVRLVWYVEGETEYFALESVLGNFMLIKLVNLRGQLLRKGAVSFRDELRNDIKAACFSFISLDSDRYDSVKAIRRAAQDDEICGMFFISTPDFEFQNFTFSELEEILYEFCRQSDSEMLIGRSEFHHALVGATNVEQLLSAARTFTKNPYIKKGEEWGRRLMEYALNNPEVLRETGEKSERQIVSAIGHAIRACSSDYMFTRRHFRIDIDTGMPVNRDA